jgi:hypothetical protein
MTRTHEEPPSARLRRSTPSTSRQGPIRALSHGFTPATALALQRVAGNRATTAFLLAQRPAKPRTLQRLGLGESGADAEFASEAKLATEELLKQIGLGAGGGTSVVEAGTASLGVAIAGSFFIVTAFATGWVCVYAKGAKDWNAHFTEQVRRIPIADNLMADGLIDEEARNNFILTGHLFIARDRVAAPALTGSSTSAGSSRANPEAAKATATETSTSTAPRSGPRPRTSLQARFMEYARRTILGAKHHPLAFLLDSDGNWCSRTHLSEEPTVQAGHGTSFHSGAPEALALEDSFFNQVSNWKGERHGVVFEKPMVEIGELPVELRTAEMWESLGKIARGTVANASPHSGWQGVPWAAPSDPR